jgi:hypothetical protein
VVVEAVEERTCLVHARADTSHLLAAHIAMLDADFEVGGPPELIRALRRLSDRCRDAVADAGPAAAQPRSRARSRR